MDRTELSEDRDWLQAFRRGESAALERVFRAYAPFVAAILRRGIATKTGKVQLTAAADQSDMIQEVFVRALSERGRQGYDGVRPYATYLAGIARFALIDEVRRRDREPLATDSTPDEAGLAMWQPGAALPDELVARSELRDRVQQFRAALKEEDQELVRARFDRGLPQREAADALGCTRHQIRQREQSLRKRLAAYLSR